MSSASVVPGVPPGTETVVVSLKLRDDDSFQIDYDNVRGSKAADRLAFEAEREPSATRLLGASVALCLSASALHCLRKARVPIRDFEAAAVVTVHRNEKGRLRVQRIDVMLDPHVDPDFAGRLERCAELFEDYCTVTESVRRGIDVRVTLATAEVLT